MIQQDATQIHGMVQRGLGQGRTLGWPTANVAYKPDVTPPAPGVYAGWALVHEGRYPAAIVVGAREENPVLVETHLIGFEGDLVGQKITLHLLEYVSALEAFSNTDALKKKIARDVEAVKRALRV